MSNSRSLFYLLTGLVASLGMVSPAGAGPASEIDPSRLGMASGGDEIAFDAASISPADYGVNPHDTYGPCGPRAGMSGKLAHLPAAGKAVGSTTAIAVLDCHPFDGPGNTRVVPCPTVPGNPYLFCLENRNDGLGNYFLFGVVKVDKKGTNPLSTYSCGDGSRVKAELVDGAGIDLRDVNGIAVISCRRWDGPGGSRVVPCPAGQHPYSHCVESSNDGVGNYVLLGVISSSGPSDPFALYGNCDGSGGYRAKSSLLAEVGKGLGTVNGIDILNCAGWTGGGGTAVVPCPAKTNYAYCLYNDNDGVGNSVSMGVILK